MSLESRKYLASPADIEQITRDVMQAQAAGSSGRKAYLQALVAVTRQECASIKKAGALPARDVQIETLERVHTRFYAIVIRTIGKCSALELNRKSNFARSAKSTLRSWIKVGNDVMTLDPARVTKASLAVDARKRRIPSTHILTKQAKRYIAHFDAVMAKMAASDKTAAAETLGSIVERMQGMLLKLGSARSAHASRRQHDHAAAP